MQHIMENGSNSQGNSPSLAMVLSRMNWGGSPYPTYEGRNEAAAPAVADGGGSAAAGAGVGAGAGSAAGEGGAAAAAASSTVASPAAGQGGSDSSTGASGNNGSAATGAGAGDTGNEANLRALRQNYESLKPWEVAAKSIKDPAAAVQAHQTYTKMFDAGRQLAQTLGYTEESFKAAFADDPADTLSHLRDEFRKANPNAAQTETIRRAAEDAAKRATQPLTEQLNRQQVDAAMRLYEGEIERIFVDTKSGFGHDAPAEVREAMREMIDSLIPDNVLKEIKTEGKVSGIQAAFDQAKARLLKVVNAYNTMTNGRAAASGAGAAGNRAGGVNRGAAAANANGANKPLTLQDIIDDPMVLPGLKAGNY